MSLAKFFRSFFLSSLILLLILPILSLAFIALTEEKKIDWLLILLPEYTSNTLILMIGVTIIVLIFGVISAWFVTYYSFFGQKFFETALFLPLSIPGYIAAYVYVNIFEFSGPVQSFLRMIFHLKKDIYNFTDIKSLQWGIIIIGFNLCPYVYMLTRAGLLSIRSTVAIAATLGQSPFKNLFHIAIPTIRPAIISGILLVLMEVISDFGTSQILAINTFTTGIYRSWFLLYDQHSASIFSLIEILFIFSLICLEKSLTNKKKSYETIKMNTEYHYKWKLQSKTMKLAAYFFCSFPVIIGFIIPIIPLISWSIERINVLFYDHRLHSAIVNSLSIALLTSIIAVTLSIIMSYIVRVNKSFSYITKFVTMGYAIPNTITAFSIMTLFSIISKTFNVFNINIFLIGTISGLLYAYNFCFLAVALGPIEAGLNKVPREIDWSSSLMGHGKISTCINIHIFMIKRSLLIAFLLVFVDTIKELSATLIMRPFNFDTISTYIYELIADERYKDAGPPSLIIVIIGIFSAILLAKTLKNQHENRLN